MSENRKFKFISGALMMSLAFGGISFAQNTDQSPDQAPDQAPVQIAPESGDGTNTHDQTMSPADRLQTIIDLFLNDRGEEAFIQFSAHETELQSYAQRANDPAIYSLLGQTYFYSEDDAKALENFNAALALNPSWAEAHCFSGLIHRFANDFDQAINAFNKAIAAAPDNKGYHYELGLTLEMSGDMDGAIVALETSLGSENGDYEAHSSLAMIYLQQNNFEKSVHHLEASIAERPDDIFSLYNLGQLYQNEKQYAKAIPLFEKVVALDPREHQAVGKLIQLNGSLDQKAARDAAVEAMYDLWRGGDVKELNEQGFYVREQFDFEDDRIFVLEYFELKGERARKYVFKRQDPETKDFKFDVSLGSYDSTTEFSRARGRIGPDERIFHLDGYAPNGTHYTYGFFNAMPDYDLVKEMALEAFAGESQVLSSMQVQE